MYKVEVTDVTLRDGEQTNGVAFSPEEKLKIARMLLEGVKVDRIEVASARISRGEGEAVSKITAWAGQFGLLDRVEVLGFVDHHKSVDWIEAHGGRIINLLCKGSLKHVQLQLRKTKEEHLEDVKQTISYARSKGFQVNLYLEDWSNGMLSSPAYVHYFLNEIRDLGVSRVMLPDTLGILNHRNTYEFCKEIIDAFPDYIFDFHGHNDYGLSVANTLESVRAGVHGIHVSVNGLGERTGNTPLAGAVTALKDQMGASTNVEECSLPGIAKVVAQGSGIEIAPNMPVTGRNVFTQCSGIHADGDNKHNLYFNDLLPERFNRKRVYALGKMSGKASIRQNLNELGLSLSDEEIKKLLTRIVELGEQKIALTSEDIPRIIEDLFVRVKS